MKSDRAAVGHLGRDVNTIIGPRVPPEAAVREQRHVLLVARADDGGGDAEHLAHSRPPVGPSLRITITSPESIAPD